MKPAHPQMPKLRSPQMSEGALTMYWLHSRAFTQRKLNLGCALWDSITW